MTSSLHHTLQALEDLIQKEKKRMSKSRFPVLRADRLRELMEESKLNQKMNKAELDQVGVNWKLVHYL